MARSALAANKLLGEPNKNSTFCQSKLATAQYYSDHILPSAGAISLSITKGAESILALPENLF